MTARRRHAGAWVLATLLALAPAVPAVADDAALSPTLTTEEPRAYGWQLGDVLTREVLVTLPDGWRLLDDSLPAVRANGRSLELRAIERQRLDGGRRERLRLHYQVMRSPPDLKALEIAPLQLRAQGPQRTENLRLEAWPVVVAPLAPPEPVARRGLGDLQPDRPPPLPEDRQRGLRLAVEAALLLLAGAGFAHARWGAWWRRGPQRPLAAAARAVRRLPRQPAAPALQAALRAVHAGLNHSAGQVLLAADLPGFLARRPALAPHQAELRQFFALSDAVFFAGQQAPDDAAAQLRGWLTRWARAERRT
jgi:mxaA protein